MAILLRGVNVGGHKRIAMSSLRALLTRLGYSNVSTILASGNAVISTTDDAARVERTVRGALMEELGMSVDIIIRTYDEIERLVARAPLLEHSDNGSRHFVAFLAEPAGPNTFVKLDGLKLGHERFDIHGSEFTFWCPLGITESVVAKRFATTAASTVATVRNWNTVEKLRARLAD